MKSVNSLVYASEAPTGLPRESRRLSGAGKVSIRTGSLSIGGICLTRAPRVGGRTSMKRSRIPLRSNPLEATPAGLRKKGEEGIFATQKGTALDL